MNRDDAIARIKHAEQALRAMGATALYLFGSTARNEAKPASDVDIFFDRDPAKAFGLIELIGMEHLLEETLGTKVDLITRDSLHPTLKADIERSAIRVL
jgi:predicted nucleotidyltransferase